MRGKIFLFLFAAIVVLTGFATAIEVSSCSDLESQKSLVVGENLPDKIPFTNEIINIYAQEEIFGSLILKNKTIDDFSCVGRGDATYEVRIQSFDVVNDFIDSEDFVETYKEKTDSKELTIKGITFGKKVKLFFVKLFVNFV